MKIISRPLLPITWSILLGLCCLSQNAYASDDKLEVVVTFSVLADLVQQVGGDKIELTTLVGANGDSHVFRPRPKDTQKVAKADVMFLNGLEFEGWIERLIQSSKFSGIQSVLSDGAHLLNLNFSEHNHNNENELESEIYDPHAWHSLANGKVYVLNILNALTIADSANKLYYTNRADDYLRKIDALNIELQQMVAVIPEEHRKVISSHDAFSYLEHDYGFEFIAPQSANTDSEASAADVAAIIRQMRKDNITAIFVENISNDRLMKQIARETNSAIGGVLFSDALSLKSGPAGTYLDMVRHNVTSLVNALD